MESQLADIRDSVTLNNLKNIKNIILDCAKNIKSNDSTFNINTLPTVSDKLTNLMSGYVDSIQRLESCQRAFLALNEQFEQDDMNAAQKDQREIVDLTSYERLFRQKIETESASIATEEVVAHNELNQIVLPQNVHQEDEDIQVEAASLRVPKDPITKKDIKVAVKSTVCNHVYDKDGIEDYFKQKEAARKRIQCPQAGCTNKSMIREELVLDDELNNLIQARTQIC